MAVWKIDINYYLKKEVLKTLNVLELYISSMVESRVFSSNTPRPSGNKNVVRFDLSSLQDKSMFFLADLIVQRIFTRAKLKGEQPAPRTFVVIDESKLILPTGKEKENPFNYLNRIVTESRKFGLGIILVSQRISHYSKEMLSNIYCKVLLNLVQIKIRKTIKVTSKTADAIKELEECGVPIDSLIAYVLEEKIPYNGHSHSPPRANPHHNGITLAFSHFCSHGM